MKKILIFIILFFLTTFLCAQSKSTLTLNGYDWNSWDNVLKSYFIGGFLVFNDSLGHKLKTITTSDDFNTLVFDTNNLNTLIILKKLDSFYSYPRNISIPI